MVDQPPFELFIARISSRFINVDAGKLNAEIEEGLADIGEFMLADRGFLFLLNEKGTFHRVAHVWTAASTAPDPDVVGLVVQEGFPWLGQMMLSAEDIIVNLIDELPVEAEQERQYCESRRIQSFLMCPLYASGNAVGMIGLDMIRSMRVWQDTDIRRLRLLGEVIANAMVRLRRETEIQRLNELLETENAYLRDQFKLKHLSEKTVGESKALRQVLKQAERVAPTDTTVLILGETGSGKELLAHHIHKLSLRRDHLLVRVNCAALTATLIESELFGREKGAYTGAMTRQAGRFEIADGATIFLDEIGEMPLEVQAKLLRVLESGELERVGSTKTIRVDVRVIAATNRNLEKEVREGRFRHDLYYRLNVFPVSVPPLHKRPEDIPLLVWAFIKDFEKSMGRRIERVPNKDMKVLQSHRWAGNIRELRNVIERAMILNESAVLHVEPPGSPDNSTDVPETLADVERRHILAMLDQTGWRVRGEGGAAERLELNPSTLESRMKRLGIKRPS